MDPKNDRDWSHLKKTAKSDVAKLLVDLTEIYLSTPRTRKQLIEYDDILNTFLRHIVQEQGDDAHARETVVTIH